MAPCCNNTVTPRMIKAGKVSVGDKIQLEDFITASAESPQDLGKTEAAMASPGPEASQAAAIPQGLKKSEAASSVLAGVSAQAPAGGPAKGLVEDDGNNDRNDGGKYIPVQSGSVEEQPVTDGVPGGIRLNSAAHDGAPDAGPDEPARAQGSGIRYVSPLYGINAANSKATHFDPIPYSQMTNYMDNVSLAGPATEPHIITPHDPLTPDGYEEEIDYQSFQALNGFLRTQIGRYMHIEQLVGSNTIKDRYGFLVGVGSNFIILQEITTGNIMVIDIYSVRLTYVYYSPPVIPSL